MSFKCEKCGREIEDGDVFFSVEGEEEFDHICEECAKEFCKLNDEGKDIHVMETGVKYPEECHQCYFCENVFPEDQMKMEGEDGDERWCCDDCIDYLVSRGEHVQVHYN